MNFLYIKNVIWMFIEIKSGKINNVKILFERIDKIRIDEEKDCLLDKRY